MRNVGIPTLNENHMSKDEVSARLRALASDDKRRSETARLRDVLPDIEATLAAGVSQADVLAELHTLGFSLPMASFKSALYRLRKRTKSEATPVTISAKNHVEGTTASKAAQPVPHARITTPADLRKARRREIDLESLQNGSSDDKD